MFLISSTFHRCWNKYTDSYNNSADQLGGQKWIILFKVMWNETFFVGNNFVFCGGLCLACRTGTIQASVGQAFPI